LRVLTPMVEFQRALVLEQNVVHRPELALSAGAFGRFRRRKCVRMNLLEREVAIHDAKAPDEVRQQQLHHRCGLFAVGALEIAVLNQSHRCIRRAQRMISCEYRNDQLERMRDRHSMCSNTRGDGDSLRMKRSRGLDTKVDKDQEHDGLRDDEWQVLLRGRQSVQKRHFGERLHDADEHI
jgi:hypothetical protein